MGASVSSVSFPGQLSHFAWFRKCRLHIDKSMLGIAWYRNEVGARVIDRTKNERSLKTLLDLDPTR